MAGCDLLNLLSDWTSLDDTVWYPPGVKACHQRKGKHSVLIPPQRGSQPKTELKSDDALTQIHFLLVVKQGIHILLTQLLTLDLCEYNPSMR